MRKTFTSLVMIAALALANFSSPLMGQDSGSSEFKPPQNITPPANAAPNSFSPPQSADTKKSGEDVAVPAILGGTQPPVMPQVEPKTTETTPPQAPALTPRQEVAVPKVSSLRGTGLQQQDSLRDTPRISPPELPNSANQTQTDDPLAIQSQAKASNTIRTIPASSTSTERTSTPGFAILTEGPQLRVETIGPEKISIGKRSTYQFIVKNQGRNKADQVIVGIDIPDWIEVSQTQQTSGNREFNSQGTESRIIWNIPIVDPGTSEKLTVEVIPQEARPFDVAVDWTVRPIKGRTSIEVTQPQLAIQISGPDEVLYGETAIYNVSVTNPGTGTAENVSVMLPEELGGQRAKIGDVNPGEQKQFQVELLARAAGVLELTTTAEADGGLNKSDSRNIMVRRASLDIQMAGPKMKFAGSNATYKIVVANTGDAMAKDVMAAVALPAGVQYISGVETAEKIDGGLRWNVGMLSPGNSREYQITCIMEQAGDASIEAATRGAGDLAAMTDIVTRVDAIADLVLTVSDPKGPLPTGEKVTYQITIKNRGTKNAQDVKIVMQFGDGIEPNAAEGLNHNIEVGQVIFTPISQIAPNEEVTLKVKAIASQSGPIRFRAQLECEESGSYEVAEGTTRFFGEDGTFETGSNSKDLEQNDFRQN